LRVAADLFSRKSGVAVFCADFATVPDCSFRAIRWHRLQPVRFCFSAAGKTAQAEACATKRRFALHYNTSHAIRNQDQTHSGLVRNAG